MELVNQNIDLGVVQDGLKTTAIWTGTARGPRGSEQEYCRIDVETELKFILRTLGAGAVIFGTVHGNTVVSWAYDFGAQKSG
jgi:hypothetical protein